MRTWRLSRPLPVHVCPACGSTRRRAPRTRSLHLPYSSDSTAPSPLSPPAPAPPFRPAGSTGPLGWADDDLACAAPWGFTLDQVQVPTAVWQGGQDLMVPLAHGRWIAAQLPASTLKVLPEHGHLSFGERALPELFAQLLR